MSPNKPFGRAQLALAAVIALSLGAGWSGQAAAEQAPATIKLLGPPRGGVVTVKPRQNVTFRWEVAWPVAPTDTITYKFELATDPGFTRIGTRETRACTPAQGPSCWTSFTPNRVYDDPYGAMWYWRVSVVGGSTSVTGSFKVRLLRDTVKPRVRAMTKTIVRGYIATFVARMADDRGDLRFRATLSYRGRTVITGAYPFTAMSWDRPFVFESDRPLSTREPAGKYSLCVRVWDRGGNTAQHCTGILVR